MSTQVLQHQIRMERMPSELNETKKVMRQSPGTHVNNHQVEPQSTIPPIKNPILEEHNQSLKLKPIKWPETYSHENQI